MIKKMKYYKKLIYILLKWKINNLVSYIYAFTLMELMVVITILSVLMLIVYSYFSWYIKESRDTARFYNLKTIDTSLNLFKSISWKYPIPTNWIDITYSWATLWTQWTFDDNMLRTIKRLNQKPIDIVSLNDFSYSLSYNGKEFELGGIIESESDNFTNVIWTSYAKWGDVRVRSMVVWNYNGKGISTATWGVSYIIALPTIISYELDDTDIVDIINKEKLSYRWYWNISAAYTWSIFMLDWWFSFKPNILAIYAWNLLELKNNESLWIDVLKNFQDAYSGTILANNEKIKPFLDLEIDIENPSKLVREMAYDLVITKLDIDSPIELKSWTWYLTYISEALLDNDTRAIAQDHLNNLWFATKQWVSKFDFNTWWSYLEKDGLVDKDVRDLIEDSSWNMWFATNKWVSVYNGSWFTNYDKSNWLLDNDVVWVAIDSAWKLWFATKKWVATYDWTTWWKYEMKNGLIDKVLTGVAIDTTWNIWFTSSKWVSKFNGTSFTNYTNANWLIDKNVISVYADTSWNVWFGTYNGISKYNWTSFSNYNISDWLVDNFVQTIYQDQDGDMWFGTLKWASKFDGTTWKNITELDGLADNDVQVIFQDNVWNMWFGTKKWVTIFFEDL